jgi:hypothetical protein
MSYLSGEQKMLPTFLCFGKLHRKIRRRRFLIRQLSGPLDSGFSSLYPA